MKRTELVFINSLLKERINNIEDIFSDERLRKYLWIEFILNPSMVKVCKSYINNPHVKGSLKDAVSWYVAFKWILPENNELERLYRKKVVKPYRVKLQVYREKRRNFLKGLIHAGLC